MANEDTLLRTHCCWHKCFPVCPRATFVAGTNFASRTQKKNVSDVVQKHFVSATNVSQFGQPKKHHRQQCVRNNVSSFTKALISQINGKLMWRKQHQVGRHHMAWAPFVNLVEWEISKRSTWVCWTFLVAGKHSSRLPCGSRCSIILATKLGFPQRNLCQATFAALCSI